MTQDKNVGEWLNERYPDSKVFKAVIEKLVLSRPPVDKGPAVATLAPTSTVNELFLSLDQLDYSREAKHGCCLF